MPESAKLQQRMSSSAYWNTYAHLKRSGGVTFQLVIPAQHLYPSFPKLQSNLIRFAFEIYLASNIIYMLLFVCLKLGQLTCHFAFL